MAGQPLGFVIGLSSATADRRLCSNDSVVAARARIDVADHVEMVVVDVDHLLASSSVLVYGIGQPTRVISVKYTMHL